jgi:hypothetical protein
MFRASLNGSLALLLTLSPMVNPLGGAVPDKKFDLTIDNIMRGVNLVGTEPAQVRWSGDSSTIYFQWKKASDSASAPNDTYAVTRDNPTPRKLSDDEARLAPPASVDTNRDQSLSVYAQDGDIVVMENATGKRRQVTKTVELETNPRFVPDGRHITFQRADNLYLLSLDDGDLVQLTDIHPFVVPGAAPVPGALRVGGQGGRAQTPVVAAVPVPVPRAGPNGTPPKGTESQEYLKRSKRSFSP